MRPSLFVSKLVTAAALSAAPIGRDLFGRRPVAPGPDRGRGRARQGGPARVHANTLRFETGKLYKLVLTTRATKRTTSPRTIFTQRIFTRKVQVAENRDGKTTTLAEFKGAIREIEVCPGQTAEWWRCRWPRAGSPICVAASSAATARAMRTTAWWARSSSILNGCDVRSCSRESIFSDIQFPEKLNVR